MKLICSYCGKQSKKLIKCDECKEWLCPVCIVKDDEGMMCPQHARLSVNRVSEYYGDKYGSVH